MAGKKQLVILGGGWSTVPLVKNLNPKNFHVTLIAPDPHFAYTPLLPSYVGGRLSINTVLGKLMKVMDRRKLGKENFIEGWGESVDVKSNELKCKTSNGKMISVPYDCLVVGVGSDTNTFGIPGVKENCMFLKSGKEATELRGVLMRKINDMASQPTITGGEIICVGAGPAGVETAAEINDMLKGPIKRRFPALFPKLKVSIVEMMPKVLPQFLLKTSEVAGEHLEHEGITLYLKTRVSGVGPNTVSIVGSDNKLKTLPAALVVWASGLTPTEFGKRLLNSIPQQASNRILSVTPSLNVIGTENIFAMGDCAIVKPPKLADHLNEILDVVGNEGHLNVNALKNNLLSSSFPQINQIDWKKLTKYENKNLSKEEFSQVLSEVDAMYKPPAPTAQNANQAALYVAMYLNSECYPKEKNRVIFEPKFKGRACYIGSRAALMEFPSGRVLSGRFVYGLWRLLYFTKLDDKISLSWDYTKYDFQFVYNLFF